MSVLYCTTIQFNPGKNVVWDATILDLDALKKGVLLYIQKDPNEFFIPFNLRITYNPNSANAKVENAELALIVRSDIHKFYIKTPLQSTVTRILIGKKDIYNSVLFECLKKQFLEKVASHPLNANKTTELALKIDENDCLQPHATLSNLLTVSTSLDDIQTSGEVLTVRFTLGYVYHSEKHNLTLRYDLSKNTYSIYENGFVQKYISSIHLKETPCLSNPDWDRSFVIIDMVLKKVQSLIIGLAVSIPDVSKICSTLERSPLDNE